MPPRMNSLSESDTHNSQTFVDYSARDKRDIKPVKPKKAKTV